MALRSAVATTALNLARSLGKSLGCELVVEVSEHSIHTSMETPDKSYRAWDPNLYQSGQLFLRGYANPIKPYVQRNIDQGEMDQAKVISSDHEGTEQHTSVVSSTMYRMYQDQHLASELILPSEKWKMVFYALLGLGALVLIGLVVDVLGSGALA